MAELFPLLVVDDRPEVLNLDQPLADKHHLRYIGDTRDPGIADQLRIESQQPCWFLRISAGSGLPFQQAANTVELSDGIHVGYAVILLRELLAESNLQVVPSLADVNPVVLGKAIEQLHARLQHAIPAVPLGIVNAAVPVSCPFPEEHRGGILPLEVGCHSLLERPAKQHGCTGVFRFPTVEIPMLVAARAGQVLADLGVAVSHEDTSDPRGSVSLSVKTESSSHRAAGAKPPKLRMEIP